MGGQGRGGLLDFKAFTAFIIELPLTERELDLSLI